MPKLELVFAMTALAALCMGGAPALQRVLDPVLGSECCCGARGEPGCCAGG